MSEEGVFPKNLKEINRKAEQALRVSKSLLVRKLRSVKGSRSKFAVVSSSKLLPGLNLLASNYLLSSQIRDMTEAINSAVNSKSLSKTVQEVLDTGLLRGRIRIDQKILSILKQAWEEAL